MEIFHKYSVLICKTNFHSLKNTCTKITFFGRTSKIDCDILHWIYLFILNLISRYYAMQHGINLSNVWIKKKSFKGIFKRLTTFSIQIGIYILPTRRTPYYLLGVICFSKCMSMKSVHQKYDPPQLIARESPVVIKSIRRMPFNYVIICQ